MKKKYFLTGFLTIMLIVFSLLYIHETKKVSINSNEENEKGAYIIKGDSKKVVSTPTEKGWYSLGVKTANEIKSTSPNSEILASEDYLRSFYYTLLTKDKRYNYAANVGTGLGIDTHANVAASKDYSGSSLSPRYHIAGLLQAMTGKLKLMDNDVCKKIYDEAAQLLNESHMRYKARNEEYFHKIAEQDILKALPSGALYQIVKEGNGLQPSEVSDCLVSYVMINIDGEEIDNNEIRFSPAQAIPGLKEALLAMKEGDKWIVYIPYQAGYGEQQAGIIPPYSTLIFNIELKKVY